MALAQFQTIPPDMAWVVICDIDGTLANNDHRKHFLEGEKKDWGGFFGAMRDDTVNEAVSLIARAMLETFKMPTILCTGRPEKYREETKAWLARKAQNYHSLYMRATDDGRSDVIVKRELLAQIRKDGYEPVFILDDRDSVVAMWREEGLTCLQVAPGNF